MVVFSRKHEGRGRRKNDQEILVGINDFLERTQVRKRSLQGTPEYEDACVDGPDGILMLTGSGGRGSFQRPEGQVQARRQLELGDCISARDRVDSFALVAMLPPSHVLMPQAG
jgi:hypothetical protein